MELADFSLKAPTDAHTHSHQLLLWDSVGIPMCSGINRWFSVLVPWQTYGLGITGKVSWRIEARGRVTWERGWLEEPSLWHMPLCFLLYWFQTLTRTVMGLGVLGNVNQWWSSLLVNDRECSLKTLYSLQCSSHIWRKEDLPPSSARQVLTPTT